MLIKQIFSATRVRIRLILELVTKKILCGSVITLMLTGLVTLILAVMAVLILTSLELMETACILATRIPILILPVMAFK
nr:MAG TPA: hypothetical protein [Caudoviricetes sp.]